MQSPPLLRRYRRALVALIGLAALAHATQYDFFCDDAFIALRYAKNLIDHHELTYNLGQRVEGFTSPLWVLLLSLVGSLGAPLPGATRALAAFAGFATFFSLAVFWDELNPKAPWWLVALPASALAMSAPFAAWIFGGLETPLFVGTFTLALALIARVARVRDARSAGLAGLVAALCTLCRPEGATLLVLGTVVICLPARAPTPGFWRRFAAWLFPLALLVGGYELFRLEYYGYPFPNTFYVKTSGTGLWDRGVAYVAFACGEFGWVLVASVVVSAGFLLVPNQLLGKWRENDTGLLVVCTCLATSIHLLYVARVGGDFLDLYRFLTPLLPAAFCILASALTLVFTAIKGPARWAVPVVAASLMLAHGASQIAMARQAMLVAARSRQALGLEPLGWTRLYGMRWQGIGEWLARAKAPTDSTAVGAAGALPFFSGLPNIDLFGLNDLEIAHHGRIIGNRPGHQRFANMEYLFAQEPTFIFMNPESTPLKPGQLRYDRYWTSRGYVPIEIRVDRALCNCPETFYHQFLVRRERVPSLRGRDDVVVGGP